MILIARTTWGAALENLSDNSFSTATSPKVTIEKMLTGKLRPNSTITAISGTLPALTLCSKRTVSPIHTTFSAFLTAICGTKRLIPTALCGTHSQSEVQFTSDYRDSWDLSSKSYRDSWDRFTAARGLKLLRPLGQNYRARWDRVPRLKGQFGGVTPQHYSFFWSVTLLNLLNNKLTGTSFYE